MSSRPLLEGIDHLRAQLADRQLGHWFAFKKSVFNVINLADLATKADIASLRADLDTYRAETKAGIAGLRADLYRLLRIQGGAIVAILAALQFLPTGSG